MARADTIQFDNNLQVTNIWLGEIMKGLNLNRHNAWNLLAAVLHALRDHLSPDQAAHLGNQLPLIIRGLFYHQWHPTGGRVKKRQEKDFIALIRDQLTVSQPIDIKAAVQFVFAVLAHHPKTEFKKLLKSLPPAIRALAPAEPPPLPEFPEESPFAWE